MATLSPSRSVVESPAVNGVYAVPDSVSDEWDSDEEQRSQSKDPKKMKKTLKRNERRKLKKLRKSENSSDQNLEDSVMPTIKPTIHVEYVTVKEVNDDDPTFGAYASIFDKFQFNTEKPEVTQDVHETAPDHADGHASMDAADSAASIDAETEEGTTATSTLGKRKKKLLHRPTVAQLKQRVSHPELVEWVDVAAPDPDFLIALKSLRHTVPVPRHWSSKSKYLQRKRGYLKPPFDLPAFIKATGITEMRDALREKEQVQKASQRARARIRPKMGKLTLDYQKLHDAFFRYQTKPLMSTHGDLYYDGREFETRPLDRRPGVLSSDLRNALGMPPLAPPPWLLNMQRYGPPPSYPKLPIPGLNAPIPLGGQWGFHPGGWGRPPVDERGMPLYGDVFRASEEGKGKIERDFLSPEEKGRLFGEMLSDEEEEEELEEIEEEEINDEISDEEKNLKEDGNLTPEMKDHLGELMAANEEIELRKRPQQTAREEVVAVKPLFTVVQQKEASAATGFLAPTHGYDLKQVVAIDPSELGQMDAATLASRVVTEKKPVVDMSDMVAEHQAKKSKKSKAESSAKKFKF